MICAGAPNNAIAVLTYENDHAISREAAEGIFIVRDGIRARSH
jgi:hypothetical protein